ncbi:MAG: hydrogenase maturation protease [Nocardioidaceae bacterium]|nr:hydrogenase maturation protease [Nocardioidaceae bacterium]
MRVLVAGIGNIFLGDDGFGPEVVRRMTPGSGPDPGERPDGVRIVDYGIRGMHLAYDLLDGYDALVLVDALPFDGAAGDLRVLEVGPDDVGAAELDAHDMNPVAVLAAVESLGGTVPPTYVVGCRPGTLEEGIGLSPVVAAAVPVAVELVGRLLRDIILSAVPTAASLPRGR